ncbi:hypothetical protein BN2475_170002 [Paraburkholderia ribeironis]|uniref:Uncharacterized protein n=1 Tax=Paraburkholderia ribeironis TaxID=1247936 RepID=A0A1N7RVD3_9BURK|nr:hypothetical protein BN2475_170002 [Paraburkholderia ribeironis]
MRWRSIPVAIDDASNALSPREAKVLRMRSGIDSASDYTREGAGHTVRPDTRTDPADPKEGDAKN